MIVLRLVKIAVILLLGVSLLSCLNKEKRDFKVNLGKKPRVHEMSSNRIFEKRQGVFATLPKPLFDFVTNELLTEFKNASIDGDKGKVKKETIPAGRMEYSSGQLQVDICTTDVSLSFSEDLPNRVNIDFEFCSLDLLTENAESKLFLNALPDKPVKLSIRKLSLKDKLSSRKVKLKADIAFGFDGQFFIPSIEAVAGLSDLSDPANYRFDLSYSGFENKTGFTGKEHNNWRTSLLKSIMKGLHANLVAALKNAIVKTTRKSLGKLDKRERLSKETSIRTSLGPFNLTSSYRLAGIVGGNEGMAIAAEVIPSVTPSTNFTSCSPEHSEYIDPEVTDLKTFHNFFTFPERLNEFDVESLRDVKSGIYLSKSFVNYLLWQPFGTRGNCEFKIPIPGGIDGRLTTIYQAPLFIEFASAKKVLNSPDDGVAVTIQIPATTLVLSREFTKELTKHGVGLSVNAEGRAELSSKSFPYTFELLGSQGDLAVSPHPFIRSIYHDRYANPTAPTVKKIAEFISDTVPNYTVPGQYEKKANALMQSLFDQILEYTAWKNLLESENRDSTFTITGFEFENGSIIAKTSLSYNKEIEFNKEKSAADQLGYSSLNLVKSRGSDSFSKWLPEILQKSHVDVLEGFSNASFLPKGWRCSTREIDYGFPTIGSTYAFLNYAVCGEGNNVQLEYRWHHQIVFDEHRRESKPVTYIKLRNLFPGKSIGPGTSLVDWFKAWPKSVDRVGSAHDVKVKWEDEGQTRYLRGLCLDGQNCRGRPDSASFSEVELWQD